MTAYKPGDPTTINRLYGRAKGKPLRQGQQGLVLAGGLHPGHLGQCLQGVHDHRLARNGLVLLGLRGASTAARTGTRHQSMKVSEWGGS